MKTEVLTLYLCKMIRNCHYRNELRLRNMKKSFLLCLIMVLTIATFFGCQRSDTNLGSKQANLFTFSSGQRDGTYYPAVKQLKDVLQDSRFRFDNQESGGSIDNLEKLRDGKVDFALAQYDALYMLLEKDKRQDETKTQEKIRIFAPVMPEIVHILVRSDVYQKDAINFKNVGFKALRNKMVAIGSERSGSFVTATSLYVLNDLEDAFLSRGEQQVITYKSDESIDKLIKGEKIGNKTLDAVIYVAKKGVNILHTAPKDSQIRLLEICDSSFVEDQNFYNRTSIQGDGKVYPWQKESVQTLSTPSFIFVRSDLPEQKVSQLAEVIYAKEKELGQRDPFWKALSVERARDNILQGFPYHSGVIAFIRQSQQNQSQDQTNTDDQ